MNQINNRVEFMESEADGNDIIYMEYIQEKNKDDRVFCFFEGIDDKHYYLTRIKKYIEDDKELIYYECGGKDNVIRLHKKILDKTQKSNVKKFFFIDRDFESRDQLLYDDDIYVTDAYSIENFYVMDECFENFLELVLGLHKRSKGNNKIDFDSAVNYIKSKREEFIMKTLTINAWYSIQSKYPEVKLNQIKELPGDTIINDINMLKKTVLNSKDVDLNDLKNVKIELMKNPLSNFRGKYFEVFLCKIINRIVQYYNNGEAIFSNKRHVSFQVNKENAIIYLSNYAYTPKSLINYLKGEYKNCISEVAIVEEV